MAPVVVICSPLSGAHRFSPGSSPSDAVARPCPPWSALLWSLARGQACSEVLRFNHHLCVDCGESLLLFPHLYPSVSSPGHRRARATVADGPATRAGRRDGWFSSKSPSWGSSWPYGMRRPVRKVGALLCFLAWVRCAGRSHAATHGASRADLVRR